MLYLYQSSQGILLLLGGDCPEEQLHIYVKRLRNAMSYNLGHKSHVL